MFDRFNAKSIRKPGRSLLVSFLVHCLAVAVLLVLPLWYFQELPAGELVSYLAEPPPVPAPPPPPPPPAPPQRLTRDSQPRLVTTGFTEPMQIPDHIPEAPDELPVISGSLASAAEGIPGGTVSPGLTAGSALSGAELLPAYSPPPPPPTPKQAAPHPVGGNVQSSKLIRRVDPVYPPLAISARIQGTVLLRATIDETGRVVDVKLISGHQLLTAAALDAVREWRYSPTLLNGEPVPVITTVTVIFKLR